MPVRTAAGRLIFHVFAALAEFERNLIRECTRAGLADQSPANVCNALGISRSNVCKYTAASSLIGGASAVDMRHCVGRESSTLDEWPARSRMV